MSDRAIRSLVVLGGGITGLSAAAAFARALPRLSVQVIETPAHPAALADRLPGSTTAIHRFHALAGLDEAALFRAGAVMPRLGLRFDGWPPARTPWFHVHGEHGVATGTVPFHQLWARAAREGRVQPYHAYAAGGVLAAAGKFVHPQRDPRSPLATYDYALRIDPARYREALAAHLDRLRVRRTPGALGSVERRADGAVVALLLHDARRIEADFFIDASGPGAPLLDAGGSMFEDWREWLPFDRMALSADPAERPAPVDSLMADAAGWEWRAPLADRTETGRLWCSAAGPDGTAGDVTIRPGRRSLPWCGNVLALGEAAVVLDPLHWLPLHLVHVQIARALDLIPSRDFAPVEVAEYNRRAAEEADRARDFAALHYLRSGRRDGVWRRPGAPPDSLARTLEQFARRGRLPLYDEDSLPSGYWLAALLGLGVIPLATDPAADAVAPDAGRARLAQIGEALARVEAQVPEFPAYLSRMAG